MSIRELFNAILDFNLLWIVGVVVGIFLIWLLVDMVDTFYESLPQSGKDFVKVMNSFGILSFFTWPILLITIIGSLFLIIKFGIYGLKFLEIYFKY
jgi:putative effector of murein hydrolase LrgA (UPF0299 family)